MHANPTRDPADSELQRLLDQVRNALARDDHDLAQRLCTRVHDVHPGQEDAASYLIQRALYAREPQRALALAERALTAAPESALLHFHRGSALEVLGDYAAAREAFEQAVRCEPSLLLARFASGAQDAALDRHDEALLSYARALAAAEAGGLLADPQQLPPDWRARIELAIAYVQQAREAALIDALAPLSAAHGAQALQRVQRALDAHLGKIPIERPHPLQVPSFLLIQGLPPRPWFEREDFPFLREIEAATDTIRAELLAVLADESELQPYVDMPADAPAAPLWGDLNRSPKWSAYHLFRHGERVEAHCRRCPRTVALLDALPIMRIAEHSPEALFSVLAPHTHIPPHTGVINGRLTVHLPLIVPPNCGALAAGGQVRTWEEGKCLVFDDSFVHEAWNDSDHTRVVLIFDIWNPHLDAVEREALAASIEALGRFNASLARDD